MDYIIEEHETSISRACCITGYSRSSMYYQSRKQDELVEEKLQEWAEKKPTEGFWKLFGANHSALKFPTIHSLSHN